MLSVRDTLAFIGSHLPPGFSAVNGIKSLFPDGYAGSISVLTKYVYIKRGQVELASTSDTASYFIGADGTGRWFMSWLPFPSSLSYINFRAQGGFVFFYTNDGQAHGFVDTSRPHGGQMSCDRGADPWIKQNWPNLFPPGVYFDFQAASGFESLPSESNIWTNVGFPANAFTSLDGGPCACAATVTGSTLFPFPNAPVSLLSPLGGMLPPLYTVLGQALAKRASTVARNLVTGGVAYTFSPPQGPSGSMTLSFASAGGCNGSVAWTLKDGAIKASASIPLNLAGVTGMLNYDLDLGGVGSGAPNGKLTAKVDVKLPGSASSVLQTTTINGQIVSQSLTNTAANGSANSFAFSNGPNGITVNGSGSLANIAAAIAAQPVTQSQLLDQGTIPITTFMGGMPYVGIWPGDTVNAESWSNGGWVQTPNGYEQTFDSNWGLGFTEYGLAKYQISVTVDSNGAVTGYGIVGTLENGPGGVNGVISCTVNQTTNTTECLEDLQLMNNTPGFAPLPGVPPDATIAMNQIATRAADGTFTLNSNGSIANPNGSFSSVSKINGGTSSVNVTDAAGNSSTATITPNSDGTSTITISTTDDSGNGTLETIDVDPQGNLISDTTTPVGTDDDEC